MGTFSYKGKSYDVDSNDFLLDYGQWDENFVEGTAQKLDMPQELTKEQWDVLRSIREAFEKSGRCPIVYETCRMNGLRLTELKRLFPAGYLRGACKMAGITYKEGYLGQSYIPQTAEDLNVISVKKNYRVDARGFLVNPDDWDEYYAVYRAFDMKIPGGKLSERHWQIIHFLREKFEKTGVVPTVYETCEANDIELDVLEELFPDGYHRGAVKIAGLRVR
ncbi:MAG: TusE/DsrC/DsvC family sulfur relay protein [Candidatus Zixiibacteriota bacterium]|nr:MAG: TusE/DsrC/DsvC family sulfur relay protein [candidate division Zixibacteria bacterium]